MAESEKHKKLKLLGRIILNERGYPDTEIFEEYKILIGRRNYIVDICGINPRLGSGQTRNSGGKAIAVECGTTNSEKLVSLKTFFDEVIVLPYGITSLDSDLRITLEKYLAKIKSLENAVMKMSKVIRDKDRTITSLRGRTEFRNSQYNLVMNIAEALKRNANRHYYSYSEDDKKVDAIVQLLTVPRYKGETLRRYLGE